MSMKVRQNKKRKISITSYPNPVNNKLYINTSTKLNNLDINLINSVNVYMHNISKQSKSRLTNKLEFNTSNFPNGIYILSVKSSNKEVYRNKLLIQHN